MDADFLPASVRGPVDLRELFWLVRARSAFDRRFFIGASPARRSSSRAADAAPLWISSWGAAGLNSLRGGETRKGVRVSGKIRHARVIRAIVPGLLPIPGPRGSPVQRAA